MSAHPTLSSISATDIEALHASGEFDATWYLNEYPNVSESGIDPAVHYLWIGRRLGRAGTCLKSASANVETFPAPASTSGSMPVVGSEVMQESSAEPEENLSASKPLEPDPNSAQAREASPQSETDVGLIDRTRSLFSRKRKASGDPVEDLIAQHFDVDFYLSTYPDVAEAGVDPVQHYATAGWREGRNPSLSFSTQYYLDNNPDVADAGVNPYYHYLAAGSAEGRVGKHQLGFRWDILSNLKPVEEQIAEIKAHRPKAKANSRDALEKALKDKLSDADSWTASFSHDDFMKNIGGIQLLLRRELELLRERGAMHFHVFPQFPLPFLETEESVSLGVLLNGDLVGYFSADDVAAAIKKVIPAKMGGSFIVHSLLGHNMDDTLVILKAGRLKSGLLWLHDYSPIYNNFKLLRNDVEYCGFPQAGTLARELCAFAQAEFSHEKEFSKLLKKHKVELISPSQAALDIWHEADVLKAASERVVKHVELKPLKTTKPKAEQEDKPLRIGFLGYPSAHKGWQVFQDIVLRHADDPRYQFYHLGKGRVGGLPVTYVEVSASESNYTAMSAAVDEAQLDVALVWSIWPETFCLTAYEAIAAGSAVITNPDAGNIVSAVNETGQGAVLEDEEALRKAFQAGDLQAFARSSREVINYDMLFSDLSLEVLD